MVYGIETKFMISVLTLTYQRYKILEEAIYSYLLQPNLKDTEMVVINDHPDVKYHFDHPNVKIINCEKRFSSVGKKLEYGFSQCSGDYIFRLDDDDLLSPYAFELTEQYIKENPPHDIYRSKSHYFFCHNKFVKICDNINNGNVYTKEAVKKMKFPDVSGWEDLEITFNQGLKDCTVDKKKYAMIYRWGMGTYHISAMGRQSNDIILSKTDTLINSEKGDIFLEPKFNSDYYAELPDNQS